MTSVAAVACAAIIASDASRLSRVMTAIASRSSSGGHSPRLIAVATSPEPSGFVR